LHVDDEQHRLVTLAHTCHGDSLRMYYRLQ
jgi:hypothetical protein